MKFSDLNKKGKENPTPKEPTEVAPSAKPPIEHKKSPKGLSFSKLGLPREILPFDNPSAVEIPPPEIAPEAFPPKKMPTLTWDELQVQRKEASQVYQEAILTIQSLLSGIESSQSDINSLLERVSEEILRLIRSHNQSLVALTARSTANNYLYAHMVNLAILSIYIADTFQWEEDQLHLLGLTALLHDIGMMKHLGLAQEPRTLNEAELQEIRMHPMESQKLLDHIKDIEKTTKQTIIAISNQVHERRGGKGYPKALKRDEDIHLAAQIIGLCDTYEAMTHHRNWREPMIPHEAVKQILKYRSQEFNARLMKGFMEQLSVFPPGSYVQLSSGEIGSVVEIHPHLPTRPTIEIKVQSNGSRQDAPALIDLSVNPMIHASRAVDETKLPLKDKKLLLQLQASRWWTQ